MAIGDDALAAGMPLVNGNTANSAPMIDDYINETRDFIAQRTNAVTPINKGGTGSTSAAAARAALGAAPTAHFHQIGDILTGDNQPYGPALQVVIDGKASTGSVSDLAGQVGSLGGQVGSIRGGQHSADIYNRTLGGSYRVLYTDASGLIGWVSSSRRFKKNIKAAEVDPRAVLALQLVTFLYKVEVDTKREGITHWGLIAEQLDELGLSWLVDYGPDGITPEGVRYDRLALALLPVVQHLATEGEHLAERVEAIEMHLDAMGGALNAPTD